MVKTLTERVDALQRIIVERQEQIRDLQAQVNHYINLLRQYRTVIEAENLGLGYKPTTKIMEETIAPVNSETPKRKRKFSVAQAVKDVMENRKGEILSQSRVYELVEQSYPDLRARHSDNIMSAVTHALVRGVYKGWWNRTKPAVYQA
ncbi:hypothetical protein LCGC14_1539350 [marine sediment metagenome]|uniref:Uncharacterized protein n=1 Tax=marine sediment metagenome TaxID=412755 RepID=A0A0F9LUA3_9ZZZZ